MAGRRKMPAAEPGTDIQVVSKTPLEVAEVEATYHAAVGAFADDEREATLLIGQRQGRKQVFDSLQKLLTVTDLEDLKQIKESNKYKGVRIKTPAGELVTVTTWADYCAHVEGRTRETIDNDLLNYEKLGAECFDALRTLGVGPSKMRELRRAGLPSDDAAALAELAKAGDKDAVLDLAEELIVRQAREKEELTSAAASAQANYDAREARINELSSDNNELREKLSLLPRMRKPEKAEKAAKDFAVILADARAHLRHAQQSMEKISELAIEADYDLASDAEIAHAATETARLVAALLDGLERVGIAAPAALVRDVIGG